MSQTPKQDNKPKYNNNKPYEWVDSQWEKFMTQQKEDKAQIEKLQKDLGTCTENYQTQRKQMEELVLRTPSKYLLPIVNRITNDMELGQMIRELAQLEDDDVIPQELQMELFE